MNNAVSNTSGPDYDGHCTLRMAIVVNNFHSINWWYKHIWITVVEYKKKNQPFSSDLGPTMMKEWWILCFQHIFFLSWLYFRRFFLKKDWIFEFFSYFVWMRLSVCKTKIMCELELHLLYLLVICRTFLH